MACNTTVVYEPISEEVSTSLLPVVTVIIVYGVIGLLGNFLVAIYYSIQGTQTPTYKFLVCLAVFDLLSCVISVPLEVVDMLMYFKFPSDVACKILRFVNYFATMTSGLFLLAIGTDRYRKICLPLRKQITTRLSNFLIMGIISLGLVLSWPSLVFYSVINVNVTLFRGEQIINGRDCKAPVQSDGFQSYLAIYHCILFVLFFVSAVALIVLYSLVAKQMWNSNKFRKYIQNSERLYGKLTREKNENSSFKEGLSGNIIDNFGNSKTDVLSDAEVKMRNDGGRDNNKVCNKHATSSFSSTLSEQQCNHIVNADNNIHINNKCFSEISSSALETEKKTFDSEQEKAVPFSGTPRRKGRSFHRESLKNTGFRTSKMTLIAICVTVAFTINFLPYLVLSMWMMTSSSEYIEFDALNQSEFVAFEFGIRSWLLNTAVNPFIYGFFNASFRQFVLKILRTVFCPCKGKGQRN